MSRNNDRGKPAQSLVAVHERVVSNQRFEESGRLAVEGRVGVLSPQAGTRPVGDRVQQANITDRAHPEIVDQGQEIFEREVIGHCPSRLASLAAPSSVAHPIDLVPGMAQRPECSDPVTGGCVASEVERGCRSACEQ